MEFVLRRVNRPRRSMRGIKTSACPSPQLDPEITATPEAMESDIVRGSLKTKTAAICEVASAFGINDITDWTKRAEELLGREVVQEELRWSRAAGLMYRSLKGANGQRRV